MNDAQILVLCALADGPLHGYAINAAIEELAGKRLGVSSLYGALSRLEAKALIEPLEGSGRQQPVQITAAGRHLLEKELRAMANIAAKGLRNLQANPA
jgi:DNA-binding PadR family transcriptional regulator